MTTCKSEDGRILFPWVMKDVEEFWNTWFSKKFGWRSFTLGKSGSASKAAYRLSMILRKNARWLDGSSKTDIDVLYNVWETKMLGASAYIEKQGVEEVNDILGKQYNVKLTFWSFTEPDLSHLHEMTMRCLGIDPDGALKADEDRRKEKARILREFGESWKGYAKQLAYLSGSGKYSNQKLEQALELAHQAMGQALDDLQWEDSDAPARVPMEDKNGRMKAGPSAETAGYLEEDDD